MNYEFDISVIVPVYNGEQYLADTLGNLLNQTKKSLEIIFVNDASSDNSLKILQDAKAAFPNVVIIDMPQNSGPGAARNAGLDVAKGKYIGFMDSDDLIDPTMYEKLWQAAYTVENGADIADCAFLMDSRGTASLHFSEGLTGILDSKKKSDLLSCGGFIVTKIFKAELLQGIRFRPVYTLEDIDFVVKTIVKARTAASVGEILYRYRDIDASLSKEERFFEYTGVQLLAMEEVYEAAKEYQDFDGIRDAIEYMILNLYRNICAMCETKRGVIPDGEIDDIVSRTKQIRFAQVKKNPRNNPYVKSILPKSDISFIESVDKGLAP